MRVGFRYVAVRGLPSGFTFTKDMLTAHFVHSDLPRVASLTLPKVAATTSTATPDILNEIYHSTLCAQMSQLWSIPTDCPQVSESFETCFGGVNRNLVCLSAMWRRLSTDTKTLCAGSVRSADGWVVRAAATFASSPA